MKEFLEARIIIFFLFLLMAGSANSAVLTFHTSDSQINSGYDNQGGYYSCCSSPGAFRDSYGTGRIDHAEFRSYFTFDLSMLQGQVTSASLELQKYGVYRGLSVTPEPSETIGLHDVSTDAITLNTTTELSPSIFDDLGTGNSYGTYTFSTEGSSEDIISIPLNSQALDDINNNGGNFFSIGVSLLTLPDDGSEYVFYESSGLGVQSLVLETAAGNPESPLIIQVADSLGNVQTNSWGDEGDGNWPDTVVTPITVNVGDVITYTAEATDPDGGALEYRFAVQNAEGGFDVRQDWSNDNTWNWIIESGDYGWWIVVLVAIRDDDGLNEMGSSFTGDDYTYLTYSVDDPLASSPAVLDSVTDSLGNVQTNSFANGGGGGWPYGVETPIILDVGDSITFTAQVTNPEEGALEYQFSVQPPGGGFETRQEWSFDNTWTWTPDTLEAGQWVVVLVSTRDNDGYHWMGSFAGDDYTYLTYDVNNPNASVPAVLGQVTDSLGNVQTNSFANGGGGAWPYGVETPVIVQIGDSITFTVAEVTDPDSDLGDLEYRFAVQPPGGGFDVKQDWSSDNNWTWFVDSTYYGPDTTVFIAVRDEDTHYYMGSFGGDDYTYAIYDVTNPPPPDSDFDGIIDDLDQCPSTMYGPVNEDGCSVEDLVPCDGSWKNHGQYMKTLVRTLKLFVRDGLLTETEREITELEGSESNCGK